MKIKRIDFDKPDCVAQWTISFGSALHGYLFWFTIWRHSLPSFEVIIWNGKYTTGG